MRAIFGVQFKDKNICRFDVHLGLNETMDQLAMENSVCRLGHVLTREDGHVL